MKKEPNVKKIVDLKDFVEKKKNLVEKNEVEIKESFQEELGLSKYQALHEELQTQNIDNHFFQKAPVDPIQYGIQQCNQILSELEAYMKQKECQKHNRHFF